METDGSSPFSSTVSYTNPITATERMRATSSSSGSGPTPSDSLSADQICLPTSDVRVGRVHLLPATAVNGRFEVDPKTR
jgi:hypothetical protein